MSSYCPEYQVRAINESLGVNDLLCPLSEASGLLVSMAHPAILLCPGLQPGTAR